MKTSLQDQKQKLNLLKPRRPASSASRLIARILSNPRRKLGIFVAVVLSGLGASVAASSLQRQAPTSSNDSRIQTNSTTVTTHQTTGSNEENTQSYVTINGETIPLENGSLSRSYTTPSGGHVDLNVHSESTGSTSSSNITIHSTSSVSKNQERGSP